MTTIDEIRDIAFYLLRKINDFLVDLNHRNTTTTTTPTKTRTL